MLKVDHSDAAASLLSLSVVAETAAPIPIPSNTQSIRNGPGALNGSYPSAGQSLSISIGTGGKHHRRLSSTGKSKRRLSDAQNAANRPSPASLTLSSLSLSPSPPLKSGAQISTALTAVINNATGAPGSSVDFLSGLTSSNDDGDASSSTAPISIGTGRSGKKRGIDHRCESCSKVYRHPSCLIKHRWEHTPHWREASKFVLSKHQQVQLLEAAAILSHLSQPAASSLPEDRSLWPSFLSGGSLPKADEVSNDREPASHSLGASSAISVNGTVSSSYPTHPISSSVPAQAGAGPFHSGGPRLHNYAIHTSGTSGGITQLRPGVIGVPNSDSTEGDAPATATGTAPQAIPVNRSSDAFRRYRDSSDGDVVSGSWASASSYSYSHTTGSHHTPSSYLSNGAGLGGGGGGFGTMGGGWSLPRSSVRSMSASSSGGGEGRQSHSRSASGSVSDGEDDDESVIDQTELAGHGSILGGYGSGRPIGIRGVGVGVGVGVAGARRERVWKREDDDDGMSIGYSVKEEDEGSDTQLQDKKHLNATHANATSEWDGLDMDMDMD